MSSNTSDNLPCFSRQRQQRLQALAAWLLGYALLVAAYLAYTGSCAHEGVVFSLRFVSENTVLERDNYRNWQPLQAREAGPLLYLTGPYDAWAYTPAGAKQWHHQSGNVCPGGPRWTYTATAADATAGSFVFGTATLTDSYNVRFTNPQRELQCLSNFAPTGELNWSILSTDLPDTWEWLH